MECSKCSSAVPKVHYLGHVFSADGIKADPRKTEAISEWPIPTSVKEVCQFVGLDSYYRGYIQLKSLSPCMYLHKSMCHLFGLMSAM